MRESLVGLGWTVLHVVDPALEIEGRVIPVARIMVMHEARDLWAAVELYANAASADVEHYRFGAGSYALGPLPDAPWSLGVTACNVAASRVVADRLCDLMEDGGATLDACARVLGAAGWSVTEQDETCIDEPWWTLRAVRDAEDLEAAINLWGGWLSQTERSTNLLGGSVCVRTTRVFATVEVRSRPLAEQLLEQLRAD